ncbi:helix-turn-helix domain-containing protein [Streptomyces eurythermus]
MTTPAQRADLAEEMLPIAAHLAVLVHGDGGPEDVADTFAGLDDTQKNALIVVLAGLVDPDQPVSKALGWLDFNEHGSLTVPSWSDQRYVRDLAPEPDIVLDDDYVDQVAVSKFVRGFRVEHLTDSEFLAAVRQLVGTGMSLADVDQLRRWPARTTENRVNRLRKQFQRAGRQFPSLAQPNAVKFTEQAVVAIRERSEKGATDLELAMSYDVDRETIRAIVRGQRYRQYGGPIRVRRSAGGVKASREYMCGHADNSKLGQPMFWKESKLTPEDRDAIHRRTKNGENVKELAAEYGVSPQTIYDHAA